MVDHMRKYSHKCSQSPFKVSFTARKKPNLKKYAQTPSKLVPPWTILNSQSVRKLPPNAIYMSFAVATNSEQYNLIKSYRFNNQNIRFKISTKTLIVTLLISALRNIILLSAKKR